MQQQEIKALLSDMSLEEKIGELFQLPSYFFNGDMVTGPAGELGITPDDLRVSGSCLSVAGAERIHEIQQRHIEKHPHHIPMLFMADIINGYRTIFPIPLAQGCTFDPGLAEKCASIAAREAAAAGLHVTFSPMADLVRDARWGRVMESTGEDTYLNGLMAAAMVRGYQGENNDFSKKGALAACLKHFAGYGAPDGGRDYNTVELSERTLAEDYLPAYKKAIEAGCALVMTSFNTLNRIPSTANRRLLREVLRGEMQFDGVVISDWCAVSELIPHGIAADEKEAAVLALNAGVDIDMASPVYLKNLKELAEQKRIDEKQIDESVLRILTLKNKLGLFENPYKDGSEADEKELLLCVSHREAARDCAEKSFVLLKNEDSFLPLKKGKESTAFIGPFTDNQLLYGSWSFFGDEQDCVTVKAGVTQNYPDADVFFAQGCPTADPGTKVLGFQKTPPKEEFDLQEALDTAVELAKKADKVVLTLGEHRDFSGEGASRADITLPSCQLELFHKICEVNPNVCVVLFNGRPLDIREINQKAKAILEAWLPGTEGGNALAGILYGDSSPSGRLSMSFPYCVGQVPVHYNHLSTGRPFAGDYRTTRYNSKYLDIPNEPLYPFGYGLTYTAFEYSDISLDSDILHKDDSICASVRVTNTGERPGTETVQMYLHDVSASVTRPVRELKGFCKVFLEPGESRVVAFPITEDMLRFYNITMDYVSEPGRFEVFIGSDSTTSRKAVFSLC